MGHLPGQYSSSPLSTLALSSAGLKARLQGTLGEGLEEALSGTQGCGDLGSRVRYYDHLSHWCQQLTGLKVALCDLGSHQVPQVHVLRPRPLEAPLVMKAAGLVQVYQGHLLPKLR